MDIRALKRQMAVKPSKTRTPTKSSLEQEKPLKTQARGQQDEAKPSESPVFPLTPAQGPSDSLERFVLKDPTPLPDDFEDVMARLKSANPDSIPTELDASQRITNPGQFLASHITALEGLRSRPGSMLFAAYYRRASALVMRIK